MRKSNGALGLILEPLLINNLFYAKAVFLFQTTKSFTRLELGLIIIDPTTSKLIYKLMR